MLGRYCRERRIGMPIGPPGKRKRYVISLAEAEEFKRNLPKRKRMVRWFPSRHPRDAAE
jgi:hypothetical protein